MNYLLFTTTQCPKCPAFKEFVSKTINFKGQTLNQQCLGFMDNIKKFDIQKAPTIVIFENKEEIFRTDEIYQLEEFLNNNK